MSDPSTRDVEIDEVLPPGKESAASSNLGDEVKNHTSKILAHWLDEFFRIPGTNFRIGLDPIIAFVPGVGDFFASSAGMIILLESARNGVSVSVLIRMGMNMLMNTVFDLIPGIGPFFSAFFKSAVAGRSSGRCQAQHLAHVCGGVRFLCAARCALDRLVGLHLLLSRAKPRSCHLGLVEKTRP
jgi:hypothetical protein